ncbi:hypothetical protein [Aliivibrio fischeri]|uniref:hypothetical protein n=1 Tax=Aliivibrio fischeri TaxID=668 RepID=UPI00080E4A66|nr:hypothetical protein [Aliivibrio fischeri]OCH47067.1 hypothetical protein A6E02_19665 [Aliivibrio fischeri]OED52245.1 hypothetical protein BEI47_19385 [Aliivibrio fischeri]
MDLISVLKKETGKLSNEQSAYLIALILFPLSILLTETFPFPSYWIVSSFLIYGFIVWIREWGDNLNSILYAKSLMALAFLAATTLNVAMASISVNSILEVPSSPFTYTITMVSILTVPFTAAISLTMLAMPMMLISMFSAMFSIKELSAKKIVNFEIWSLMKEVSALNLLGRIFASLTVFFIATSFLGDNSWYTDQVAVFTKWFAYNFEMETYSYCSLPNNAHISYLDGERIIIGINEKSKYIFTVSNCITEL